MRSIFAVCFLLGAVTACVQSDPVAEHQAALVAGPHTLDVDQRLYPGQERVNNGRFRLTYQSDGNLVLYDGGTALWHTNTQGTPPGYAVMQSDGNLVVYDANHTAVWYSSTFWPDTTAWVDYDRDYQGVSTGTGHLALCGSTGGYVWSSNNNPNACKFLSEGGNAPGGGGDPGRTCAATCTGCMPLGTCLNAADQRWENCESTGAQGTDGACYRLKQLPATCEEINPWSRACGQCWIDCGASGCPSSIPPLCTCETNGFQDRSGNQCCYMETQDPFC